MSSGPGSPADGLDRVVLDTLLQRLAAGGLVGAGGKMRTDSTHVISAVRDLNRLELAGESVRACLEQLAVAAPQVVAHCWTTRGAGGTRPGSTPGGCLPPRRGKPSWHWPTGAMGTRCSRRCTPRPAVISDLALLARLHQVEVLRVVLVQNYLAVTDEQGREVIKRREADAEGLPPGRSRITSPYDLDARWGVKRDTFWNGYKVHVTETCDPAATAPPAAATCPAGDTAADADGRW